MILTLDVCTPPRMLEPFAARFKLLGFTNVYKADGLLETPIAIHQGQGFSYCDILCLAQLDDAVLNPLTGERPMVTSPNAMHHNSWSRMMCIAQCYAILFVREGNDQAVQEIVDTWQLPIRRTVEVEIAEHFADDGVVTPEGKAQLQQYSEQHHYDPLVLGRLAVQEITVYMASADDGWNQDGSLAYDAAALARGGRQVMPKDESNNKSSNSSSTTSPPRCTANCIPYRDTTGYIPRNHPQPSSSARSSADYNVTGSDNIYWQPLLEDDGRGYLSRQEHVTPHIGYAAMPRLRSTNHVTQQLQASSLPNNHSAATTPYEGNYRAESLLVIERLRMAAQDTMQWDKITFYDKKFLLRLLIQESLKEQFSDANPTATTRQFEDNNSNPGPFLTFEDELFFVHGISAVEYDAVLHAWRAKRDFDLVRPTTVIQSWGNDIINTFAGMETVVEQDVVDGSVKSYQRPVVGPLVARDFQAFLRVMPHSEFPSGSACICTAYHEFTDAWTTARFGRNLTDMRWGYGGIDLGCTPESLQDDSMAAFLGCLYTGGFDIPSMTALAEECGQSRLWGGMHFTASVPAGHEICQGLGDLAMALLQRLLNRSSLGMQHAKGNPRPQCSSRESVSPTTAAVSTTPPPEIDREIAAPKPEEPGTPRSENTSGAIKTNKAGWWSWAFIGIFLILVRFVAIIVH